MRKTLRISLQDVDGRRSLVERNADPSAGNAENGRFMSPAERIFLTAQHNVCRHSIGLTIGQIEFFSAGIDHHPLLPLGAVFQADNAGVAIVEQDSNRIGVEVARSVLFGLFGAIG